MVKLATKTLRVKPLRLKETLLMQAEVAQGSALTSFPICKSIEIEGISV